MKIKDWCGTYRLDENKNAVPCSTEIWAKQFTEMFKNKTKHVAQDIIEGCLVSTVWLGIDHQWGIDEAPLLYETMVFDKYFREIYCARCSTWQEAEEGHKEAIQWVKDGCIERCM